MSSTFRIAFYIGNFPIYWYSLTMLTAVLVAFLLCLYRAKRRGFPLYVIEIAFMILVPVGFIGARLGYVLPNINEYHSFAQVLDLREGGLSIQGATLTPAIVGIFYFWCWRHKFNITVLQWADMVLPNLLVAQFIGRFGNFFNQEILGPIAGANAQAFLHAVLPSFIYNHLHLPTDPAGTIRQPFFLYEGLSNLCSYFIIIYLLPRIYKQWKPGTQFSLYFIAYGLVRAIMELYRDKQDILYWMGIPTSFATAIIYLAFGAIFVFLTEFFFPRQKNRRVIFWTRPRLLKLYIYNHANNRNIVVGNYIPEEWTEAAILKPTDNIYTKKYYELKKSGKLNNHQTCLAKTKLAFLHYKKSLVVKFKKWFSKSKK